MELRTLGRAAAELDQDLALEAEAPKVQIGRGRGPRQHTFLFPTAETAVEVEWQAQSTMRYHGRVADLAASVTRAIEDDRTTLFVVPSLGVAERITEILAEYQVESRLSLLTESTETTSTTPVVVTVGRLSGGFALPKSRLVVHVESDVFDEAVDSVDRQGTRTDGRSDSSITATAPSGNVGSAVDVVVTANGLGSMTGVVDRFTYLVLPTITAIAPAIGPTVGGASVVITGTNFDTSSGGTTIRFGGISATNVTCSTTTGCMATFPRVAASSTSPRRQLRAQAQPWRRTDTPMFPCRQSLASARVPGRVAGGTAVTITGTNFITATGATTVTFGSGVAASLSCSSTTQCVATSPPSGPISVDVAVTTAYGTSASNSVDLFSFISATNVSWTQISPPTVPSPRQYASMVYDGAMDRVVMFGGYTGVGATNETWTWWLRLVPTISVDRAAATVRCRDDLRRSAPSGRAVRRPRQYVGLVWRRVVPAFPGHEPAVPRLRESRLRRVVEASYSIRRLGRVVRQPRPLQRYLALGWLELVSICSPRPSPRYNAQMAYDAATGTISLFGGQAGGAFTPIADTWSWDGKTWTQLQPATTSTARAIGTMTYDPATGKIVLFGGYNATLGYLGDTWVWDGANWSQAPPIAPSARTGAAAAYDPYSNAVMLFGGGGNGDTWAFTPIVPAVSGINPNAGPNAGGTAVTIAGSHFLGTTAVLFGGVPASSFNVDSDSQITATSSLFGGPTDAGATVDILVVANGLTSATSVVDQFTYLGLPAVNGVSPASGSSSGGGSVVITGTNFITGTAGTTIRFGSAVATGVSCSGASQCVAISPPGTGVVDVAVTTAGGTSATGISDRYTYTPAPSIAAISPTSGPVGGGTVVSITGANSLPRPVPPRSRLAPR